MCVPWELNPQPFALLTQCSTTEPHRNTHSHLLKTRSAELALERRGHSDISEYAFVGVSLSDAKVMGGEY